MAGKTIKEKVEEALDAGQRMAGRIQSTTAGAKTYLHPLKFKVSVSRWHQPKQQTEKLHDQMKSLKI